GLHHHALSRFRGAFAEEAGDHRAALLAGGPRSQTGAHVPVRWWRGIDLAGLPGGGTPRGHRRSAAWADRSEHQEVRRRGGVTPMPSFLINDKMNPALRARVQKSLGMRSHNARMSPTGLSLLRAGALLG